MIVTESNKLIFHYHIIDIIFCRQHLFAVCRELQVLFNEEREMSIKTVAFAKLAFQNEIGADALNELKV